ncbi:hypothetical protein PGTUg99_030576 [Puccinia graminis f. sp. tritici]|nr:hypothetical protein PGTUg99_030576 [Puccinia graminis f. sp. tritici]
MKKGGIGYTSPAWSFHSVSACVAESLVLADPTEQSWLRQNFRCSWLHLVLFMGGRLEKLEMSRQELCTA